ncbi:Succinate-semialdehyde dehydrogenase [NADP(+)] [Planctomycetes bacterium Pan216]|uniref:aldehyde dehydrogenase (NAD(+)) n=1 Tax=Kolteria novifilia TaxID=2527975 RepID=A0A518B0X7_9BACT|nr:Succinate-semialdehyde dehydrogenase [NADP(+)] [Planctomycetes bacterium Pan216]
MLDRLLSTLGLVPESLYSRGAPAHGHEFPSINPTTGEELATVRLHTREDYGHLVDRAQEGFRAWRRLPAPVRGEVVRKFGMSLRAMKVPLAKLLTLEMGKPISESEGEVQEMIDMCDFAVGLSRQLHGLTIASERPLHRLMEQWHPLGPIGIITAFNFPVAVWAWNAALAAVCGDTMIWKPSPETPLTSLAVARLVDQICVDAGIENVFLLCLGDAEEIGETMIADRRLPLISATGSTRMGARVGEVVARRLGRSLLELGGNNAAIVAPSADLELALRAILFAAVGTAGQRCTTLRRLLVHESLLDAFLPRLVAAYRSIPIGDPMQPGHLMGPLVNEAACEAMANSLMHVREQGGEVLVGGGRREGGGFFVEPAIVRVPNNLPVVRHETFAPILYVMSYRSLDEAIALQNGVSQGLSSSIFTRDVIESEAFLSAVGSDCGIANVNIGTSGAEIGGAFGGEKETGGGREAGSDAWKAYMRRQTCTINYGSELPLAQGVEFHLPEST